MLVFPAVIAIGVLLVPEKSAPALRADPVSVSFDLQWVRQDPPATAGGTAPAPVILLHQKLSTLDGQVATGEIKSGINDTFFVSLSPTVESADNKNKGASVAGTATPKTTIRTLWSLRVVNKELPGGVQSVTMTGATRLVAEESADAVVAQFSLSDPKTGRWIEYRLVGHTSLNSGTKIDGGTPVTSSGATPYK